MSILHDDYTMEAFKYSPQGIALAAALKEGVEKLSKAKLVGKRGDRISRRDFDEVDFSGIIRKHTKAKIKVNLLPGFVAQIRVAEVNKNNIFLDAMRRMYFTSNDSDRIMLSKDTFDGYVDLEKYEVGGDFENCFAEIDMGDALFGPRAILTADEVVGVMLHEIGHNLWAMLAAARFTRTSLILQEGTKRLLAAPTKVERIRLLRDIEEIYGAGIPEVERYAEVRQHPESYKVTILQLAATESTSQIGDNIYDARAFEQMADQFAARAGYAMHLTTGLDKLFRMHMSSAYFSPMVNLLFCISKILMFVFIGSMMPAFIATILFSNPSIQTYDKPKRRIERLKEEIQGALREKDLSDENKEKMLAEIEILDGVLKEMYHNEGVYEFIWDRVFPWGRKQRAITETHMELEKLLNNPMYRTAAALSIA